MFLGKDTFVCEECICRAARCLAASHSNVEVIYGNCTKQIAYKKQSHVSYQTVDCCSALFQSDWPSPYYHHICLSKILFLVISLLLAVWSFTIYLRSQSVSGETQILTVFCTNAPLGLQKEGGIKKKKESSTLQWIIWLRSHCVPRFVFHAGHMFGLCITAQMWFVNHGEFCAEVLLSAGLSPLTCTFRPTALFY